MRRLAKNLILYCVTTLPIIFLVLSLVPLIAEARFRMSQVGADLGAFIGIFVAFLWTIVIVPVAYMTDAATQRMPQSAGRILLIISCAVACYLSTLAIAPAYAGAARGIFAVALGGAAFGAAFARRITTAANATA